MYTHIHTYIHTYIKYCILTHNLHTFSKPSYISCHLCLHVKDISKRILSQSLDRIGVGTKSWGWAYMHLIWGQFREKYSLMSHISHDLIYTYILSFIRIYLYVSLLVRFCNLLWLFTIYIFWNLNLMYSVLLFTANSRLLLHVNWYDMIYLLTAIGLTPSGSSTVHIYTQTIHRTIQLTQTIHRKT
jgi:hypothetical protein